MQQFFLAYTRLDDDVFAIVLRAENNQELIDQLKPLADGYIDMGSTYEKSLVDASALLNRLYERQEPSLKDAKQFSFENIEDWQTYAMLANA